MSSTLLQEYEEGMKALGESRMKYFKFFSLFSFENGNEVHFGDGMSSFCDDRMHYEQLKEYIKEQKKWIRTESPNQTEMRRRAWWLLQKLLEFGVFSASEFRTILLWCQNNEFTNTLV
jgi:hypothetical protein